MDESDVPLILRPTVATLKRILVHGRRDDAIEAKEEEVRACELRRTIPIIVSRSGDLRRDNLLIRRSALRWLVLRDLHALTLLPRKVSVTVPIHPLDPLLGLLEGLEAATSDLPREL